MGHMFRLPAEWEEQSAVLIAWPHKATDWNYMLEEVENCCKEVAKAIVEDETLIIVSPEPNAVKQQLADLPQSKLKIYPISTNDTWARDFGPISVLCNNLPVLYDFKFNAWGLKFAANFDNLINSNLYKAGAFGETRLINHLNLVLEGGSIESDGNGCILTTASCLLSKNRNGEFKKNEIEKYFFDNFGTKKVLWLNHGFLEGDDTDSHIDTLARICPGNTIMYVECNDINDCHYTELHEMKKELEQFTDADGNKFKLVKLPMPRPIYDEDNYRLPATYANFLITNKSVLVPTYGQPDNDNQALEAIKTVFHDKEVKGIDCNALIKQHGSLHCITMQLIKGII